MRMRHGLALKPSMKAQIRHGLQTGCELARQQNLVTELIHGTPCQARVSSAGVRNAVGGQVLCRVPRLPQVPLSAPFLPFLPKVGHLPIDILIERTRKKVILPVALANTQFLRTKLEYQMFSSIQIILIPDIIR